MLSTARAGRGSTAGGMARPSVSTKAPKTLHMVMSLTPLLGSGLGAGRKRIGVPVLGERPGSREREVRAADHHLVGDDPVDQLSAALNCGRAVLVVGALPLGVWSEQRGHVHGVRRDHQLLGS